MLKIYVITWRYGDGSGSGALRVFTNKDRAEADLRMLMSVDAGRQFELEEVEWDQSELR